MGEVIEHGVANDDVTGLFGDDASGDEQLPLRHQVFVGRFSDRLPRGRDMLLEGSEQLLARIEDLQLALTSGWLQIQLVHPDGHLDPRRQYGHQHREVAWRHRSRVRLPLGLSIRYLFERASRVAGLAVEFGQEELSELHLSAGHGTLDTVAV